MFETKVLRNKGQKTETKMFQAPTVAANKAARDLPKQKNNFIVNIRERPIIKRLTQELKGDSCEVVPESKTVVHMNTNIRGIRDGAVPATQN